MSNIENINEYILKFLRTVRSTGFNQVPQPLRDWVALFAIFVVLIVISLAFSLFLLLQVQRSEFATVEQGEMQAIDTIDSVLLEEILDVFKKKEQTFNELKSTSPQLTDPSV